MAKRREHPMIGLIRSAVKDSGLSLGELSRRSGVSQPQLSRFMSGDRSLNLNNAVKLFEALGLELVRRDEPAPESKKGRKPR